MAVKKQTTEETVEKLVDSDDELTNTVENISIRLEQVESLVTDVLVRVVDLERRLA